MGSEAGDNAPYKAGRTVLWSICYEADQGVRVPQGQKGPAQGQASEPRTAGARSPLAAPPRPPRGGIVPAVRPGGPGPDVRRGQRSLVLHKHVSGQGSGGGDDSGPEAAGREAESFEPLTSAAAQEGGSGKAAWLTARPRARGWRGPGRRCPRPGLGRGAAPPARAAQRSGGTASILLRPCILITAALIFMSRDSRGTAGCHLLARPRTPAPLFLFESWASSLATLPPPPPRANSWRSAEQGCECAQECELLCGGAAECGCACVLQASVPGSVWPMCGVQMCLCAPAPGL